MLLARIAEALYWAGRYIERAEATARVVNEHTSLLVDLPTSVPLTWEPLIDIPGSRDGFVSASPSPDRQTAEHEIIAFLLSDTDNPSSLVATVAAARNNLRGARDVLSREAWQAANGLYLYVSSHCGEGVERWSRSRFLSRVVTECQQFTGIVDATMGRDAGYDLLRLGRAIERADMTSRILRVRALPLLTPSLGNRAHDEVQWMALLRSVAGQQAYYQAGRAPAWGTPIVEFILHDIHFPWSVAYGLRLVQALLERLPSSTSGVDAARVAQELLIHIPASEPRQLNAGLLGLQEACAALHDQIASSYFPDPLTLSPSLDDQEVTRAFGSG